MWKAFTGRSESGSTSGLRRKKSSSSRAGASDAGLPSTLRRDEEGERGHKSSRSAYGEDDGKSSSSVYATAPSSRLGSSGGRGLTESAVRSLGNQGEDWEDDDRAKSEKRSKRGEGSERRQKSSRSEKERSRSREGKERRRESTSQRDSGRDERSHGKSRARDVVDTPNGERGIPPMGSFDQFPGQYSAALVGPTQSFHDSPVSGALPSADPMHQFPSQIPRTFTRPQMGPTRADSYGQASEYYMDEGQSVGFQPGHRAGTPNMLVNPTLHLHAASAEPHTALDTGHGSASDFYGGEASSVYHEAVEPATNSPQRLVSGRQSSGTADRPSNLAEVASTAAAAVATAGVLGEATSSYNQTSSTFYQQNTTNSRPQASTTSRSPGRSYTAPGAAGSYYAPAPQQIPLSQQGTPGRQSSNTNSNVPLYAAGAAAAGAAAYGMDQYHQETTSQMKSSSYYGGGGGEQGPPRPPLPRENGSYVNGGSGMQPQQPNHFHEHRGPMTRLKDGFLNLISNPEDVRRMEEYTEYIGVCKHCFDPRSTPYDGPRQHHFHRRPSQDSFEELRRRKSYERMQRMGSSEGLRRRVDKDSRYNSSDRDKRRQSGKAEMVGAGLAAAGVVVGANALFNDRKDFDDTYSVKSGHRASSAMRRRSRSSSRERRRRSEHGVIRAEPRQEYVTVRTKDGRVEKRQVAQSERFDSRERRDGLVGVATGAAIGATAASVMGRDARQRHDGQSQGAFVRRHSGSQSPNRSPGLGEIFGFSNRKPSRVARRSPNGSYYTAPQRSRRGSEEEVGMLGSFFSPSQNERKRSNGRDRPRKQKGFFSLGNGSSASSDDDMAFGGGHASKTSLPIRRKSSRRTGRKSSDEHLAATVAGIGVTAAALAAAQKGQRPGASSSRPELGPRRDVRVQYEGQHGHGQVDEDGWEDELPSDADDASSTHSALAFGAGSRLSHRQSFESVSSGDGLSAWGWRWGGKDRKKKRTPSPQHPSYPPRQSGPSFGMVDAGLATAAIAGVAHEGPGRVFERESAAASMPSVPQQPMQYIDPRPMSEAGSQHDSMPGAFEPSMARPGPAPLQQPQPITPVSPAFVQDTFFDERPKPRRTASSPARGNFGLEDVALIGAGALAAGSIIASQGRKGKESSNVRFGLTDEQKLKEDRQRRRERQEADEERRRADRTRALKEEAERHAKEEDASRREELVRQRREEENRLAAEAALERQRAEQREAEQQADLDRERGERERREQHDLYEREQRRLADEGQQQEESRKQWEAMAAEEAARDKQARVQREAQIQEEIEARQRELDEQASQRRQVDEARLSRQRRDEEDSSERQRVEQQGLEDERSRRSSSAWAPVAAGAVAAATVGAVLAGSEHGRFREADHDKQRENDTYPERQALYHPVADDKPVSYAAKQILPDEQPSGSPIMDDDLYDKDFFSRKRIGSEYSRGADPTRTTADKVVADMDAYYHRPAVSQAEFFAPKDILSQPSAGKTKAADPYDDNDVHFSRVTDEAPRSYDQWGARSKAAPYGVPSLNVISPTPPPGTDMAAKVLGHRPPSPLARSSDVQDDGAKPAVAERPSKRDRTRSISWGEDKTHVYDPPTPESYHEGDSYTHPRDVNLEGAAAAGAALNEIVVEAAEPGTGTKRTAYRAGDLPSGDEPLADHPAMYRQPLPESIPDPGFGRIGIDSPGTEGAPPVRGYVEGETDELTPLRETPSHMPGAFDDDSYQGDPRGPQERYEIIEPSQASRVPAAEPEEAIWEAPLSKKDKKKRDKTSKRSSTFDSEPSESSTPVPADIPLPLDESAETPREELSEFTPQSDRKARDRVSKRADTFDDEPRDLPTPVANGNQSPAYRKAEPLQDEPIEYAPSKKDKKKKDRAPKRGSTFDEYSEPSTPAPVEAEPSFVTPFETPAEEVDNYFVSKKDKKKKDKASKRGSTFDEYSEPSTPAPIEAESSFVTPFETPAEEVDDFSASKKDKKKRDKASKRTSTFDEYSEPSTPAPAESDRTIAESTEAPLEEPDDYFMSKKDKKKREKASKRGVSDVSSPIGPETDRPEISEDAPSTEVTASEADAPKLSKKEQKKRDKESKFNDFADIATAPSVDPEIEAEWTPPTKKGKKGKKSKEPERDLRDIEPSDKSEESPAVDHEEASAMPGGWGPETPLGPSDPSQSQTRGEPSPDAQEADSFGDFSSAKSKKQKKRRESGRFNEPAASSPLRSEWTHDDYIGPQGATSADQPPSRESTLTAEPAGYTNGNGHARDGGFSQPDPATAPATYDTEKTGRDSAQPAAGIIATSAVAAHAGRASENRAERGPEYEDDRRRFDDTGRYHSPEDARYGSAAPESAPDHDDRRRSSNGKSHSEGRYGTEADEVDDRSTAASEPIDDYGGSRKSKHRSRHEDDDTASVASSGSRHVKDESPTAKKEKKGGIFGLFSRKSTETVPLSRQSTHSDEAPLSRTSTRNGDEEDGERKHHRRKHREGSVRDDDDDDTRSMTSESRHRHHRDRDERDADGEKRRHSSRHGSDEPENRSESGHRHHHRSEHDRDDDTSSRAGSEGSHRHHHHRRRTDEEENNSKQHSFLGDRVENLPPLPASPPQSPVSAPVNPEQDDGTPASAELETHPPAQARGTAFELGGSDRSRDISETNVLAGLDHGSDAKQLTSDPTENADELRSVPLATSGFGCSRDSPHDRLPSESLEADNAHLADDLRQLPALPPSRPASPVDTVLITTSERDAPDHIHSRPSVEQSEASWAPELHQLPAIPVSRPASPVEGDARRSLSYVSNTASQPADDLQLLPALPISRPESPVETPGRPVPPARPTSTTAIPLRFPFGYPRSPNQERSASFGSPLTQTPVSPSSTPKKARPSSTEFRPLYLVERNRKPQEVEETLPSLPSSKPSSRASSVHSSEDWQSAAESPSSSESAKGLTIDVQNANAYSYEDNDEYLGSEQATPKASEFPQTDFERPPRQAPQFYTWEDFEQDERWHNAANDHHAQVDAVHSDAKGILPDAARDELEPQVAGSLPALPDSRPGSPYQPGVKPEVRGGRSIVRNVARDELEPRAVERLPILPDSRPGSPYEPDVKPELKIGRSALPDAARDELEPHATERLPILPDSRPGSPYEPGVNPRLKGGRSAKAIAAAAMLGGAGVIGHRATKSPRDGQSKSEHEWDTDVRLEGATRASYPLPAPMSLEATAVNRSVEDWPSMSRKSSKKKKGKGKSGSRQTDPPDEFTDSQDTPEPDRIPQLQPIETDEARTNEAYAKEAGDQAWNSPVERVRTDDFVTGGRLAEDGVVGDHAAVQSFPSESHLAGEGDRKYTAKEFKTETPIRAEHSSDANESSHIAGQPAAEDYEVSQINGPATAIATEFDRAPALTSTASSDGNALHTTDEVLGSAGSAAYIPQVRGVGHAQTRELSLQAHENDVGPSTTTPEPAVFRQSRTTEADVTEQPKSQVQENPISGPSAEANCEREASDAVVEQPDEETWQPLPKKSKKGKKGNKSVVFDSGLSTPTEGPVAGLRSQGFPVTSAIPADALYNALPETPDEQSDVSWLPPSKKNGKKGKKEAQAAAPVPVLAAERGIVDEGAQDPGTDLYAFQDEPRMLENTLLETDLSEMPSKKKGKKGKKAQRALSYGDDAEASPAYLDTSMDDAIHSLEDGKVIENTSQPFYEAIQVNTPERSQAPETTDSLDARPETKPDAWEPFSTGKKNKKGKKSKKVDFYEPADLAESPSTVPKLSEEEAFPDRAERSLDAMSDDPRAVVNPTGCTTQSQPWRGTETAHESTAEDLEQSPGNVADREVDNLVSSHAKVGGSEHQDSIARHLATALATPLPYEADDDLAVEPNAAVTRDSDLGPRGARDIVSREPDSGDAREGHLREANDMSRNLECDATSATGFDTGVVEPAVVEVDRGGPSDLGGKKRKGKKGKRAVFDFAPDLEPPAAVLEIDAKSSGFDTQFLAVEHGGADDVKADWREPKSGRKEQRKDEPSPKAESDNFMVTNASRETRDVEPSVSTSERREPSANTHGSNHPFAEPLYGEAQELADTDRHSRPEYAGHEDIRAAVPQVDEDDIPSTQKTTPLLHPGVDQPVNMAPDALETEAVFSTPIEAWASEPYRAGLRTSIHDQARTAQNTDANDVEAPHHQLQSHMAGPEVPELEDLPPLPASPTVSAMQESFDESKDHQRISSPLESRELGEDSVASTHDAASAHAAVLDEPVERAPTLEGKGYEQQQTDHAFTVPPVEAGSATARAAPADAEDADEEQFIPYPSFSKPSKKGKKDKKKKGMTSEAEMSTDSPDSATFAKPMRGQADGSDGVPLLVAGAAALTTTSALGGDEQPVADREIEWPSASMKRSKKDKRKAKTSGFASPFPDQEPLMESSAGDYDDEKPEVAAAGEGQHDGNSLTKDGERAISPVTTSRPTRDIDFAATLAAGLADSGFDPDLVVNDSTFHRRATPPGTLPEADPEEFSQTRSSKRKKKAKQSAYDDAPAEPAGERAVEEQSRAIEDVQMPDQPTDGFDVDVAHSLQQSGFDPALLQQATSSHEATSSGVTEDETGLSFATNRRKKKGKGGKAAATVGLLGLATSILHGGSREEPTHSSPPDADKEGIHDPHADLTHPVGNADQVAVTDEANASASAEPTVDNDPAHTFNVAGDGELDVDEMDKAYSAFKKKDRRKKKKQKAVAEDTDRAPALPITTHSDVHSRAASRSRDTEDTEPVRGFADTSIPVESTENVRVLSPDLDNVEQQSPSMTSPASRLNEVASYEPHGPSLTSETRTSLTTALDGPSESTDRNAQPASAIEELQREQMPVPYKQQPSAPSPEHPLRGGYDDYDPADTTSAPREAPASDYDGHRMPAETARAPAWSFAALDGPHMGPESPILSAKHHEIARDSGYQEASTPILNRQSGESTGFKTPEVRGATSRESLRSRRSVEPLHIVTDTDPGWDLNVAKKRTLDETPDQAAMHSRTPSREVAATPLESTTKNRASYLFSSPPANLHDVLDHAEVSTNDPRTATSDYFNSEQHATPIRETSSRNCDDALSIDPLSPRGALEIIPEEYNNGKRSKDDADIGGSANVKAIRRTETPQAIRSSKERALSPSRPTVTVPTNTTRASRNPLSTDDLINRLSWPAVDDDNSTVNINRSLKRGTPKPSLPEARSPSVVSNVSNASRGQRIISPGDPRSFSRNSNRSLTPTLRRIDRSLSGDLRAASRRGDTGSSVGARSSPRTIPFEAPPTPPSNDEDVIVAGAAGAAVMADVFQGYGDARGSQVSPTRPPSVRKRQSMHITDLESKLDQLVSENQALQDAKYHVERNHEATSYQRDVNTQAMHEELETRDLRLHEKEVEIGRIQAMLQPLREEIDRLSEINGGLTEANRNLVDDTNGRYATLQAEHAQAHEQWQSTSRDLDVARQDQSQLTSTMRDAIAAQISSALADKNAEIRRLREELDIATEQIRSLQVQIQSSKSIEFLTVRDEDYFDGACQKLCQHVQQWVLRFSKLSDNRACRLSTELRDDKIESRIDNAILDGSDVDKLLGDRIKRRDVFMSVVMTMVWEFVFTRYLFGMDREQRQKLKTLEKILAETGPPRAIAQWRATTLTLLSKRPDFARQCALDTEAVAHEVFALLTAVLPPPSNAEQQLLASLQKVIGVAADLAIEMRTQRAEYIMLPPLQPEYDTNGDLVRQVHFNALLMNERSGLFSSNEGLEQERAVVKIVLFPLVVKKGDEYGQGEGEIVVCPAQVLVQNEGGKGKKVVRVLSGAMEIEDPRRSRQSLMSAAPGSAAF
ncbi:hypothetical protein B0A54_05209 [Friedmanniomyces endolithicus]|uniref:Involucrin repeat protein n=1 Tax=Friedmanniomyces endolithicus TaxID=329885 RepID=A0A4U0V6U4_9PEZI|nr:hypothetical protein B0A54_05209 [Friedmanniomyces endolithicus]